MLVGDKMKPLAYRIRPTEFIDVFGQDHLVSQDGVLSLMLKKKKNYCHLYYMVLQELVKPQFATILQRNQDMNFYFLTLQLITNKD